MILIKYNTGVVLEKRILFKIDSRISLRARPKKIQIFLSNLSSKLYIYIHIHIYIYIYIYIVYIYIHTSLLLHESEVKSKVIANNRYPMYCNYCDYRCSEI